MKTHFEDFAIGDSGESAVARTVSESDVYEIAGLSGSYNQLHTDAEYMKDTDYGRRLVQNTLLIVLMEGLYKRIPGWDPEVVAAYGRDGLRFINPVFIGDTLDLEMEVVEKEPKEAGGVVTFEQRLYNQDDELVAVGEYLLLLASRES